MKSQARLLFPSCLALVMLAVSGCTTTSSVQSRKVDLEFAEIGSSGSTRHVFDQAGNPMDVAIASSITLTGTVTGIIATRGELSTVCPPGGDHFTLDIAKPESDKLREWSGQRVDREAVILVGNQIVTRAVIRDALSGATVLPIPATVRSDELKAAIAYGTSEPR